MERRRFCIHNMAQKKLLRALVVLFLLPLANANELDDLIASQDLIVKKHMPDAQTFINAFNNNTSNHKLLAEEIIKNSNTNCKKYENFDWFNELNLSEQANTINQPNELYIFVSLSMPQSRLINLLQEAKSYGGIVVLRGLKNNSYKDTANFLQPIIKQAEAGFIIEPNLFEKYNINKVPSVILNDPIVKKYDQITGNINLKYALEEMAKVGELKSQAQAILRRK